MISLLKKALTPCIYADAPAEICRFIYADVARLPYLFTCVNAGVGGNKYENNDFFDVVEFYDGNASGRTL